MQPATVAERIHERRIPYNKRSAVRLSLLAFTLFYFADVCLRASAKYFWYDEILTLYFSRLPNLTVLWSALHTGIESNPPAFHLLTRAVNTMFGEGLITTRLPEIVSFWIVCLCLFKFVERRAGVLAGIIAMTLPMLTGAYYYAYEARPLIIVVAFCALALLCWDNATNFGGRKRWLIGFSLALFCAFMFHCYAILLVIPFGLAELVSDIRSHRVQWSFWIALSLPLVPAVALYLPLLRAFKAYTQGTDFILIFPPVWSQVFTFYSFLLLPCSVLLIIALALYAFDKANPLENHAQPVTLCFTSRDMLVVLGLVLLPAFGVLVAQRIHSPYFSRYFLSALLGVCIPFAILTRAAESRRWTARLLALILICSLGLNFGRLLRHRMQGYGESLREPSTGLVLPTDPGHPLESQSLVTPLRNSATPIAVLGPLDFLFLVQYAPDLRPNWYYVHPTDTDAILRGLRAFRQSSPVKFNPVFFARDFAQSHSSFYVYADTGHLADFYRLCHFGQIQSFQATDDHLLAKILVNPASLSGNEPQ